MSDPSNELLSNTIVSILLAFEASPRVVEQIKLDEVGSDPFTWVQSFYKFVSIDDTFVLRINVLFGIIGLSTLLSIATLIFQYTSPSQAGVRWLFKKRYHTQSRIPYIVPHPINIVVLASLFTGILLILYLGLLSNACMLGKWGRLIRVSSWFPAVWFPFYTAVWLSGFGSLYLTYLVPSQYTRRGSLTGARRHASPILVNALCFGVPLLCVASVLPLQVKQSGEMRATMRSTRALHNVLGPLALAWQTAPNPISDVSLAEVKHLAGGALASKRVWQTYWTAELVLWSFWSLMALAIAVPFCMALVLSTHRRISRMATSQIGLDHWSGGQCQKRSPPIGPPRAPSPTSSIKEDFSPSPRSSVVYSEPLTPRSFMSTSSVPPYTSPATSFPSSTMQSPSVFEHSSQPFFTHTSPVSFSSEIQMVSSTAPEDAPVSLPQLGKGRISKSAHPHSRYSIQALRRMSHSAVFPSRAGALDHRAKTHLDDLNNRYWHIAAEYTVVLLVMVLICAFALFELASQSSILLDCPKKVLSTIVVSFTYGCLVNVWLSYNLYRMYRDSNKPDGSSRSGSTSDSSTIEGKRRSTEPVVFEEYQLPSKRPSKSLVHFADMVRNGSQLEPERRPSSSPPPFSALENGQDHYAGLNIEIRTDLLGPTEQRPSVSGQAIRQSFERRRSSFRAPSMDLADALAMGPGTLNRRYSTCR